MTITEIKQKNKERAAQTGRAYWFGKSETRCFNTKIHGKPVEGPGGVFFVTSERMELTDAFPPALHCASGHARGDDQNARGVPGLQPPGFCSGCGSQLCQRRDLREGHGDPMTTEVLCTRNVTESLAVVTRRVQAAAAVKHRCARCGQSARWVSGAGQALCARHQEDY